MTVTQPQKRCTTCKHCGWEPDSDLYCGHPMAFQEISCFGASFEAMARADLCTAEDMQLWERRRK